VRRARIGRPARIARAAAWVCACALPSLVQAADCRDAGLSASTRLIVELLEAGQGPRDAEVFRSADGAWWFIPLAPGVAAGASAFTCTHEGETLRRASAQGDAVRFQAESATMTYIDRDSPNYVLDMRRRNVAPAGDLLPAAGLNYQLNANYVQSRLNPSAQVELFGYRGGWFGATSLGLVPGKTTRFETYALKEDVETARSLRLGDAVTGPTVQGESLRFAGVSWGTDPTLQPADFAPVLPDLRGGNVVPGPMELYINDTLQFQQTLRSGVYDLRNVPAQLGFNRYRVRTTDALGNAVTVEREIYLPATLLPAGQSSFRLDAGLRRRDFLNSNFRYGAPVLSTSWARGLDFDTTTSVYALATRDARTASAAYDRRLSDAWAAHASLHVASGHGERGWGWKLRAEGGTRLWRATAEALGSPAGLPSLDAGRGALLSQQLLRAQWAGWSWITPGFTLLRSHRVGDAPQQVATLSATLRPGDSGMTVSASLSQLRNAGMRQNTAFIALLMPLDAHLRGWRENLAATTSSVDGGVLSRLQYSAAAADGSGQQWNAALNHDSRSGRPSADASWAGQTSMFELAASGRAMANEVQAQVSARSAVVFTQGSTFFTRPVGGAFAVVNTGQADVAILHDNRPVARTNAQGMAFVPGLRALEPNRISLDPTIWPIEWHAPRVVQDVTAPRGGGVMVSFRINAQSWPTDMLVQVLDEAGVPWPAGTEVRARADRQDRVGVIDRKGQLWLGELLPATRFSIRNGDNECEYDMPDPSALPANAAVGEPQLAPLLPRRCVRDPQWKS
jgi:outer membrane usher protein